MQCTKLIEQRIQYCEHLGNTSLQQNKQTKQRVKLLGVKIRDSGYMEFLNIGMRDLKYFLLDFFIGSKLII